MSTTRMNVQFTERQKRSLEDMADDLGSSQADVLRTALALLKVAIRERKAHNQIAIVNDDKIVKEIVGILD